MIINNKFYQKDFFINFFKIFEKNLTNYKFLVNFNILIELMKK